MRTRKNGGTALSRPTTRLQAQVKAGSAAPIDADYAQLQARQAQADLATAEDAYRDQIDQLKVRLGLPLETPLDLLPREVQVPLPELELPRALGQAMASRLDLQTTRDQVDDASRQAEVAKDQLRGDLNLTGALNLNTDPTQRYAGVAPSWGASTYATGLKYSLPLDRVNESSSLRQSLIGIDQARRTLRTAESSIEASVRSDIRNIRRARINLALQETNILLAERRLEQTKLKERKMDSRPILDAED